MLEGYGAAAETVDLELVLLADASGSIDDAEIRFQRQGYASAITHPEVLGAIAQGFEQRIAVTYVEWGDACVAGGGRALDGDRRPRHRCRLHRRPARSGADVPSGRNAIGNAIAAAHALIEANGVRRLPQGDRFLRATAPTASAGCPGAVARGAALAADIVINGLAILCRAKECSGRPVDYDLEAAFAGVIIGGPASFVVTADRRRPLRPGGAQELVVGSHTRRWRSPIPGVADAVDGPVPGR